MYTRAAAPGDRFCGVYHRPTGRVLLYTKGGRGKGATSTEYDLSDPSLQELIEPDLWEQLQEEVELLEVRLWFLACVRCTVEWGVVQCRGAVAVQYVSLSSRRKQVELLEVSMTADIVLSLGFGVEWSGMQRSAKAD